MNENEYKGYPLFNDIEDKTLQLRNRAAVMRNIFMDFKDGEGTKKEGFAIIIGYFAKTKAEDRKELMDMFNSFMKEDGYEIK